MIFNWRKYEGYREVTAYPAEFSDDRFTIDLLWKAVERAEINYGGWPFIFVDPDRKETYVIDDGIETVVDLTKVRGYEWFETWKLRRSGLFFHRRLMVEETDPHAVRLGKVLGLEFTVYHVSDAVGSLWHLYRELGISDDELVTIHFTYVGVRDRNLVVLSPDRMGFMGPQICRSKQITAERCLPLGEWRASEVNIAAEISAEIFQQFQWIEPSLSSIKELASNRLARKQDSARC